MSRMDVASAPELLTEPVTWLVAIMVLVAVFVVSLRPRRPGARGEAAVARRLRRSCAEVANDLILRDGRGGLTQIDHLALTSDGLLVVETKDLGGLIFGQAHDRTWTQCIGRQKRTFENPLRQALPLTTVESIHTAHRDAWETVMSHVLTDRLSRQAHLVIVQRRKQRW